MLKYTGNNTNMPENTPQPPQKHEGPWRKLNPGRVDNAQDIHEPHFDKTGADRLDEAYGEGNWVFDSSRFDQERALDVELARANNRIAMEGLSNVITHNVASDIVGKNRKPQGDTYVDNDGNRLTGKVRNVVLNPVKGDILISPDGDQHFTDRTSHQG